MERQPIQQTRTLSSTRELTITAMFIALTLIFTYFVNIRLPIAGNGGLIHLGNVPLFMAALLYGKRTGAITGAVGMGLFDLLSGWTAWAPCTFVVVGLMGYTVGAITTAKKSMPYRILAIIAALAIKIVGYYIFESVLYHNWIAPLGSIPGNIIQVGVAGIVVLILIKPFETGLKHLL
ncbi:MAG: ECF transporter S component [Velocimicrobium sp.]